MSAFNSLWRYPAVVTLTFLSGLTGGCGLTQSISDGTSAMTRAIFYKQIKTLKLDFIARASVNPDEEGASLATDVWIYQLKDRKTFDQTDYQTLLTQASTVLKDDILAGKDIRVRPDGGATLNMPIEKEAMYVAVVAHFRTPDLQKGSWRLVLQREELIPDAPLKIILESNVLQLQAEKE
ncbi:type VI secretion system lipoprotein TssJ [Rahnella sp. C60]|uniref:type VI secretion system lipoprotein TssJ n=1 Tax=Rahnella perminowiae TaxID=2816244 RepID=UPI001C2773F8|nr:type VI secretion system lipoprotein TssJ [Rahnella perminowiae]MBU9809554.1 type VI secretion system lipoprotein TssJ [Rahnella perminowiae]MBU9816603.1 type VI secretion system lipoprotein TssJ [Rahnella perminowiae]